MHTSYLHKIRAYTQFATKFTLFARCFGVTFTTEERKYIRIMFQLMAAIDIFIDSETVFTEPKAERFSLIEKCSRTGDWSLAPQSIALRVRLLQISGIVTDLSVFNALVIRVLKEEILMRKAETFEDFVASRSAQNRLASEIIFIYLLQTNPTASMQRLSEYTAAFAVAGGYIDSLFDMALDYKENNISIKPSFSFRVHLLKEFLAESKKFVGLFIIQPKIFFYLMQDIVSVYKSWFVRTFRLV